MMDFTYPVTIESFRLLLPFPEEETRFNAIIRPFGLTVSGLRTYLRQDTTSKTQAHPTELPQTLPTQFRQYNARKD